MAGKSSVRILFLIAVGQDHTVKLQTLGVGKGDQENTLLRQTVAGADDRKIFAEQGDYESLMTLFYLKRSYQAIYQHYKRNPNSKALPFLLQDFVNNTQEAADMKDGEFGGKLFIRDISGQEAWQMEHFCEMVVQEGKTEVPCMWKSAKAWLEFLLDKPQDAARDIIDATALAGGSVRNMKAPTATISSTVWNTDSSIKCSSSVTKARPISCWPFRMPLAHGDPSISTPFR